MFRIDKGRGRGIIYILSKSKFSLEPTQSLPIALQNKNQSQWMDNKYHRALFPSDLATWDMLKAKHHLLNWNRPGKGVWERDSWMTLIILLSCSETIKSSACTFAMTGVLICWLYLSVWFVFLGKRAHLKAAQMLMYFNRAPMQANPCMSFVFQGNSRGHVWLNLGWYID